METMNTVKRDHHANGWRVISDDMVVLETDRLIFGSTLVTLDKGSPFIGKTPRRISEEDGRRTTFARYDEKLDRRITG